MCKCQPKWDIDQYDHITHMVPPVPPSTISVFLDPGSFASAASALEAAIIDWNSVLGASGIKFARVDTACATGPGCITVQGADLGLSACGFSPPAGTDPVTGGYTRTNLVLQLNTNANSKWTDFTSAGLERTFVHELGHRLGLKDADATCDNSGNSAMMQANFDCAGSPSTSPTINDYLPINNTVYGAHSRNTCGF